MSTRFTERGVPMAESLSLQLAAQAREVHQSIVECVATRLAASGHGAVTPSLLSFLEALDCGVNYGSEIARRLKVSRQMVARTVRELVSAGYLEQGVGDGRQKPIRFTESGERLISSARQLLVELDRELARHLEKTALRDAVRTLESVRRAVGTG